MAQAMEAGFATTTAATVPTGFTFGPQIFPYEERDIHAGTGSPINQSEASRSQSMPSGGPSTFLTSHAEARMPQPLGLATDQNLAGLHHMPVVSGRVGSEKAVSILRDTGCSTCVVRRDLIDPTNLTGETQDIILMDGTVRQFPVAEIEVDSPNGNIVIK